MVIVWGRVTGNIKTFGKILSLSTKHVRRSRKEPGCISHEVYQDMDDLQRIVFLEKWEDKDALQRHFSDPDSQEFIRQLNELAASPPVIEVYESEPIEM